ncbi:MAG: ureidoglycolate lyase [Pseudomonadota bacterium]
MSNLLTIQPLSKKTFLSFGDVLETQDAGRRMINEGNTERFHALARAQIDEGGTAIVSLFRGQPRQFPFEVAMMERHPLGSQAFYPIDNRPWLVIVADDENGQPGRPVAFLADGRQGVNYAANVWHHPLMALDVVSDFLVVDRDGPGANLEEYTYAAPYLIESVGGIDTE